MKIVSWNMAHKYDSWRTLTEMKVDLALLQETCKPPSDVAEHIEIDPAPWRAGVRGRWRTAIAKLSDRVCVEWLEPKPIASTSYQEFAVSTPGTLSAARIYPISGDPIVVVSMCSEWERPHFSTGSSWIYADASAHRIVSDLAIFVGRQKGHRVIAAGDLNILRGYGEGGSKYWRARYDTVFARFDAMGLPFVGPQHPNGKQAEPWPSELPEDSKTVPTFHSNRQSPATAARQLDFVFASDSLADHLRVRALNEPETWGPSDHCRILVELKC
ncbi:MAG: hypothetical protein F4Z87_04865 [Gammaproteobacteria bacterium]|nr:hypothetical protein [Gammaproteobacteria bacterium]